MHNSTPDFGGMDPGQAGRALIRRADELQRKAEAYRGLHQEMSELTVTETSTDGMVRVSVDAQGVPTELTLTERARGMDPARLSAELMTCLRRAHSTLATQVQDLVAASTVDSADSPAAQIVACYRDRFGDLGQRPPARHARRTESPDDDTSTQVRP
ncbi:MAG TPA: YbaB/EbfC family nucleoid-associated protein [Pseudonocardiaceae bacterium]|nr:YbaB/EbfC family nucleoid-associated protein [Pseudonocardiaceae bacterium]